jgi:hypothetical protein
LVASIYKPSLTRVKVKPLVRAGGRAPSVVPEKILEERAERNGMADDERTGIFQQFLKSTLRSAGRQLEEAKSAYTDAKRSALADLPQTDDGKARIVCRRYAERRAVRLDNEARPACFDPDHPDCQGCAEDVQDGSIETW